MEMCSGIMESLRRRYGEDARGMILSRLEDGKEREKGKDSAHIHGLIGRLLLDLREILAIICGWEEEKN